MTTEWIHATADAAPSMLLNRTGRRPLPASSIELDMDTSLITLQCRTLQRHETAQRIDTTRAWRLIRQHYSVRRRLGAWCSPIDDLRLRYDDFSDAALRRCVARLARTLRAQQRWDE